MATLAMANQPRSLRKTTSLDSTTEEAVSAERVSRELLLVWPPVGLDEATKTAEVCRWILPVKDTLIIGRREDFPLQIDEKNVVVSRNHAELACQSDDSATLTDRSTFGTYLCQNQQWQRLPRHQPVKLNPGDLFMCS